MIVHSLFLLNLFKEPLAILFPLTVVIPLQQKIRITTVTPGVTVLWPTKEPGGIKAVTTPILTVCIITDNTHQMLMESTGITGKATSIQQREQK